MKKVFLFLLLFSAFSSVAGTIATDKAVLQGMDKVTGRVRTLSVPVGQKVRFEELDIVVEKCLTKTPEETPENTAFLKINQGENNLFTGWMFSSNPALSAMEDAVYDVWVVACENTVVAQPVSESSLNDGDSAQVVETDSEEVINPEEIED